MASLKDVMFHFLRNFPNKDTLSKARLTKMVYLADWRSAITRGKQITDIQWQFDNHGPYVHDVADLARRDEAFDIEITKNFYGAPKNLIVLRNDQVKTNLTQEEQDILDVVISSTQKKSWDSFIQLIYSTYPIRTQERYEKLDLVKLAKDYEEEKKFFAPSKI